MEREEPQSINSIPPIRTYFLVVLIPYTKPKQKREIQKAAKRNSLLKKNREKLNGAKTEEWEGERKDKATVEELISLQQ